MTLGSNPCQFKSCLHWAGILALGTRNQDPVLNAEQFGHWDWRKSENGNTSSDIQPRVRLPANRHDLSATTVHESLSLKSRLPGQRPGSARRNGIPRQKSGNEKEKFTALRAKDPPFRKRGIFA